MRQTAMPSPIVCRPIELMSVSFALFLSKVDEISWLKKA
jgi:hypothetical protein